MDIPSTIWTINSDLGLAIRDFNTESYDEARKYALEEIGTANAYFLFVTKSTEDDIIWVKMMGGFIPSSINMEQIPWIPTQKKS